jgi:hypothetical protein
MTGAAPTFDPLSIARPDKTLIKLERSVDGLTFVIPPPGLGGLAKGNRNLFSFGVFWLFMTGLMTFTDLMFVIGKPGTPRFLVWLALGAFWATSVRFIATGFSLARRRALIIANNGRLQIAQQDLFGKKSWVWPRESIAFIRAGPMGIRVGGDQILELQVYTVEREKVGLFETRTNQELRWMAGELRAVLQVPDKIN